MNGDVNARPVAEQEQQMIRKAEFLRATLNPDKAIREQAEEALRLTEADPQHAVHLFTLAVNRTLDIEMTLRHSAVIYLKNLVKRRWDPPEPPPHRKDEQRVQPLNDADKYVVREYLVDALTYAEPKVRSQLALCLRHIAFADYPDKWPSLLPAIGSRISSNDESQLHGGLLALRVLAKIHEYRRERKPVNQIVGDTFPVLLNLLRTVISAPPTVAGAELATLATKIIWSCTQYSLPPQLMDESTLDHFFETLLGVLAQPLPEAGQPQDEDEATAWAPWKVKKRVTQLLQRFISRHGEIKKGENGEETDDRLAKYSEAEKEDERMRARFARVFQDRYSCKCLQGVMELLARSKGGILPGRVKTYCLNYIEEAVKYKSTYISILKPNLEALYSEVIFPALCFNKEDAELWEEDPSEFVRRGFDFVADFFSPKTAAQRLLLSLIHI